MFIHLGQNVFRSWIFVDFHFRTPVFNGKSHIDSQNCNIYIYIFFFTVYYDSTYELQQSTTTCFN